MVMGTRKVNSVTARLKQDYLRLKKDPVPYVVAEPVPSNILEHYVVKGPENTPYEGGLYHGKLVFPREFPFKPPSIYMTTPSGRFRTNTRLCLSISDFHPDTWNPAWSVSTILTGLLSFMVSMTSIFNHGIARFVQYLIIVVFSQVEFIEPRSLEASVFQVSPVHSVASLGFLVSENGSQPEDSCFIYVILKKEKVQQERMGAPALAEKSRIERSPTLGSIESSDYEKRQLAAQSLQFNLKDKTFCELFPDLVSSIKTELERRAEAERTARSSPQTVSSSDMQALLRNQFGHNDQSPMHNAITNLCVIIGFAAFAFTVKNVTTPLV
uniref:(California timema) hypothetical protein n=1 Tax=Timema californicum TaxID=61474 RepID=A0A7R9P7E5_TIMCA|nr:unnamed protein product [Timema californicum]